MRRWLGRIALGIALLAAPGSAAADVAPLVGSLHEHWATRTAGRARARPTTSRRARRSGSTSWAAASTPTTPTCRSSRARSASTRSPLPAVRARRPGQPARLVPQVGRDARAGARRDRRAPSPPSAASSGPPTASATSTSSSRATTRTPRSDGGLRVDGDVLLLVHARDLGRRRLGRPRGLQPSRARRRSSESDPAFNWNDFAYVPAADDRMVGIEVFNDRDDFGERRGYPGATRALDKGWHLGAVGAEDLGHRAATTGAARRWPKTVILADGPLRARRSRPRCCARRFYAIRSPELRLDVHASTAAPMGSRLARARRARALERRARSVERSRAATLELVTSGGRVVATGHGELAAAPAAATAGERYYFVRARDGTAARSPTRARCGSSGAAARAAAGRRVARRRPARAHLLLARRLLRRRTTTTPGPEEFYTLGLERRRSASSRRPLRGLDYLAITDHNDVRSSADPDFGSAGVIGVPAYENSLDGHAQMLGARGSTTRATARRPRSTRWRDALRADGGVFQANHPADGLDGAVRLLRRRPGVLDWEYGYDVRPDTIEVWNVTSPIQLCRAPTGSAGSQRGARVGATGGSDSHWLSTVAVQGVGNPTTWVLARRAHRARRCSTAIRAGRTTIVARPAGAGRRAVPARGRRGRRRRVRVDGRRPRAARRRRCACAPTGCRRPASCACARTARRSSTSAAAARRRAVRFRAPDEPRLGAGHPRARARRGRGAPGCEPNGGPITTCAYDHLMAGLTSPIYLGR